jgi:hypothetical protein
LHRAARGEVRGPVFGASDAAGAGEEVKAGNRE